VPRYYVLTYDPERGEYTPQRGVRKGPYTLFGLRKALRQLEEMGYEARKGDSSVLVYRDESWTQKRKVRGLTPCPGA